ncbi:hypothetical protein [Alteromonas lipolytica]|nr:hypothetical protein [Alteromonas lipolytica]GGF75100.1 hypothetical protein GCM10011338_28960 [Alteromonas lipolytica]
MLTGCGASSPTPPEQPQLSAPVNLPFDLAVNVFSSYLSQTAEQACFAASSQGQCRNDGIASNEFLAGLEQLSLFRELSPSVSRHDYELLIANQLTETPATQQGSTKDQPLQSFSEFSVEWRGVQLDSFLVHYWHQDKVTPQDIQQIILRWAAHAEQQHLFTTPYLYKAMGASDYSGQLVLPQTLGKFRLSQQYLYPDPFKGVLARYLHPEFTDAIVDIAVYPVLAPLTHNSAQQVIHELEDAVEQAKTIAAERAMNIDIKKHQHPISDDTGNIHGMMSELAAEGDDSEALYASIYLFRLEDKFVKFSTTFPSRIGDPLVIQALRELTVPGESALMKELRQAL